MATKYDIRRCPDVCHRRHGESADVIEKNRKRKLTKHKKLVQQYHYRN
ncbi:MAG: hypothetical protein ACLTST_13390 [Lachnospiraceae bacterium]